MSHPNLLRSSYFPPAERATASGLLALGGRLSTAWLLDAYRHGIFPWPSDERLLAWWSPDPRAIIEPARFHVPTRLWRIVRSERFEVTANRNFDGVINGCATARGRRGATWLTPAMIEAYGQLHAEGHAHSVECWQNGALVGGVYGVAIAGLFAAESMFYRASEASKVALVRLVTHLAQRGYRLIDIQQLTPHTQRFGAFEISRADYLARLARALEAEVEFGGTLVACPASREAIRTQKLTTRQIER